MEATIPPTTAPTASGRACSECDTENVANARFCRRCGAAIAPPPECPKCKTSVPADARFCASCGAKLLGARPAGVSTAPPVAAPVASAVNDGQAALSRAAAELPPPPARRPGSSIGTNVLLFVAVLMGLVVVIYVMNKDSKEGRPSMGGPAPSARAEPAADPVAAPPGGEAVQDGAPIRGKIVIAEALSSAAAEGTLFIILRNQLMQGRGPPVAVKKIEDPKFPLTFEVGPEDMMMRDQGIPFAGPFDISVRLDRDGNAMTKDPGDLVNKSAKSGVTAGDNSVEIVLDERL